MFGCFTFAKLDCCFVKQKKKYLYFFTTQNVGAVAADLLDICSLSAFFNEQRRFKIILFYKTCAKAANLRQT